MTERVGQQGSISSHGDIEDRRLRFPADSTGQVLEISNRETRRIPLHLLIASDDAGNVARAVIDADSCSLVFEGRIAIVEVIRYTHADPTHRGRVPRGLRKHKPTQLGNRT